MGCECDRGGRYFIPIFYYGSMEPLLISGQGLMTFQSSKIKSSVKTATD